MTELLFFGSLAAGFFISCQDIIRKEAVRSFIQGTYVTEWQNEFSKARDTLIISSQNGEGSESYTITRRIAYVYNGQPGYKLVRWMGIYNESNNTIVINNIGRVLSFDPNKKECKTGTTTYKKI